MEKLISANDFHIVGSCCTRLALKGKFAKPTEDTEWYYHMDILSACNRRHTDVFKHLDLKERFKKFDLSNSFFISLFEPIIKFYDLKLLKKKKVILFDFRFFLIQYGKYLRLKKDEDAIYPIRTRALIEKDLFSEPFRMTKDEFRRRVKSFAKRFLNKDSLLIINPNITWRKEELPLTTDAANIFFRALKFEGFNCEMLETLTLEELEWDETSPVEKTTSHFKMSAYEKIGKNIFDILERHNIQFYDKDDVKEKGWKLNAPFEKVTQNEN